MPLIPESATVDWFNTFSSITVNAVVEAVSTSTEVQGNSEITTEVAPIPESLNIVSVEPVNTYPADPTVIIEISTSSFAFSGIYKNMMGTQYKWRDLDYALQESIVPPEITPNDPKYDKIIQVISPPIQNKPWPYTVLTTNDNLITVTTETTSSSISSPTSTSSTAALDIVVNTGTTSSSIVLPPETATNFTKITTIITTTETSTSTVGLVNLQSITTITFTVTNILTVSTSTQVVGTSTTATFTMIVQHTTYSTVKDKILIPLLDGQPPDSTSTGVTT